MAAEGPALPVVSTMAYVRTAIVGAQAIVRPIVLERMQYADLTVAEGPALPVVLSMKHVQEVNVSPVAVVRRIVLMAIAILVLILRQMVVGPVTL